MNYEFKKIKIPEELDHTVEQRLKLVYAEARKKKITKGFTGFLVLLFVLGTGFVWGKNNSATAKDLPLIGNLFVRLQNQQFFFGDYDEVKQVLSEEGVADNSILEDGSIIEDSIQEEYEQKSDYSVTSEGITMTLSEVYCNASAVYLSVLLHTDFSFSEYSDHVRMICYQKYNMYQEEILSFPVMEGEYVDENTFIGIIRLGFDDYLPDLEVPDSFSLELDCSELTFFLKNPEYSEEPEVAPPREKDIFYGQWKYQLNLLKNAGDLEVIDIHELNDSGIGLETVSKDRFEIVVKDMYASEEMRYDYFPVILDAEGKMMLSGGISNHSANCVAIQNRDISKIDVYLVDDRKWMDEYKGNLYQEDGTLKEESCKEYLDSISEYHKEIIF